jgi:hypothetical protein
LTVNNLSPADAKSGSQSIIRTVNFATGRGSKDQDFTEANWGPITRNYLRSINRIQENSFAQVVTAAQVFMKETQRRGGMSEYYDDEDEEDERAMLVDV